MSFLNCDELYYRQVHQLNIAKSEIDFPTLLQLPSLFPHLEELKWEDYSNDQINIENITEDLQKQLEHWKKIKSITETNRYLYTPLILKIGSLPMLTKLNINLHFQHTELFQYLDHAPNLNHFDITNISLSLRQIELLHEKLPKLEVLCLAALTQITDESDSDLLANIQPALKLHTLYLDRVYFSGASSGVEREWLKYISLKYTNMINFTVTGVGMGNPQPYYETGLIWIAEKCIKIQNYLIKIYPLTPAILATMDASGTKLKTVVLGLEGIGYDQLEDISNSGQKDCINNISLTSFDRGDSIFQALQSFSQLKELTISSNKDITLNTSLKQLPQLERLTLSSMNIINLSDTEIIPLKLKSLVLDRVFVDTNEAVFGFLAASAPLLSKLSIRGQVLDRNSGPLNVHFPSHYFEYIKVSILGDTFYRLDNDSRTTWFNPQGKMITDYDQQCAIEINGQFYASILCEGYSTLQISSAIIT